MSWQSRTCWSRYHHQSNKIFWFFNHKLQFIGPISDWEIIRCKQLRGQLQQQKIADLPQDRMCVEPPFTYCGVDLFWSFVVKDGWKEVKKYGAVYTCLSSRAIHIEVVHSLSTDSFILSLRRFIGQRGIVRMIGLDNGKNFISASAELCAFQKMNHKKVGAFLEENGGDWMVWKRNPWHASNMGGVWEQQIRTLTKKSLRFYHELAVS